MLLQQLQLLHHKLQVLVTRAGSLLVFVVVPLLIIVAEEDGVGEVVVGDRGDRELRLIPADAARGTISD